MKRISLYISGNPSTVTAWSWDAKKNYSVTISLNFLGKDMYSSVIGFSSNQQLLKCLFLLKKYGLKYSPKKKEV